jgi:hypothetical protein
MKFSSALLAPLDSPQLIGTPTAPTPVNDNSTRVATTAFVRALAAQHNLVNGKLVESHAGNAATFAIKTLAGSDPSTSDPVMVIFPDASILTITAALSLVIPSGATVNIGNYPCRLWFALANDAGTPRLVAMRAVTTGQVVSFDPRGVINTVAPLGNNACTYYSTVAFTSKPYRVIAFADYESGIPTAGSWTVSPTRITMVGPNTPLPGDIVQTQSALIGGLGVNCNSGGWVATTITAVITPFSPINPIQVECYSDHHFNAAATADHLYAQLFRNDVTAIGIAQMDYTWSYTTIWGMIMFAQKFLDFPVTTAATRYRLFGHLTNNGSNYFYLPWGAASLTLQEIMA